MLTPLNFHHPIETAGIKHKVDTNQVRAIQVLLIGSNMDMKQIEADRRLGSWCSGNLKWLWETYGSGTSYQQSCTWKRRQHPYTPLSYR